MKSYRKEIKKNYAYNGFYKGIIVGSVLAMIGIIILAILKKYPTLWQYITLGIICVIICSIIGYVLGNHSYKKVEERIQSLEIYAKPLENEIFKSLSKELALGEEWLVFHNGNDYRFWTKNTIGKIMKINGKEVEISDKNSNERSRIRIGSSMDIDNVLNQWIDSN